MKMNNYYSTADKSMPSKQDLKGKLSSRLSSRVKTNISRGSLAKTPVVNVKNLKGFGFKGGVRV